ncbi:MAG: winged helix-turn-helix domain-containing protein [Anaerolineae bacterium]|nr:winged helix-turn-helix domain-containing protein [Anaerolineae bacterium]
MISLKTLRHEDAAYLIQRVADGDCSAVVGVSNTGKSDLLRSLATSEVSGPLLGNRAADYVFIYVDFNLMLEATEQGFYELILRSLIEEMGKADPNAAFLRRLSTAYDTLVAPPTAFQISLSFSEGLTAVCQGTSKSLVLLFDEFDEPFEQIEGRVFLNLRALKDKYRRRLTYVTATDRRLSNIRRGRDVDEFVELFEPFTRFLGALCCEDADMVISWVADVEGYTFGDEDRAFIYHHADGHFGLLMAVSRALGEVTGEPVRARSQDWLIHRQVREQLDRDLNVQGECRKLWEDLTETQRDALMAIVGSEEAVDETSLQSLRRKGIVRAGQGDGSGGHEPLLFSPVFEAFVRRHRVTRRRRLEGVRVDVESGNVWVDGQQAETLTELEYRLLLLLYGRLEQIVDKYEIVEAVWGEEYIDQVDDARIDKLLSRLRAKIEPDVRNPRYLVTVRGRGYRLVNP